MAFDRKQKLVVSFELTIREEGETPNEEDLRLLVSRWLRSQPDTTLWIGHEYRLSWQPRHARKITVKPATPQTA